MRIEFDFHKILHKRYYTNTDFLTFVRIFAAALLGFNGTIDLAIERPFSWLSNHVIRSYRSYWWLACTRMTFWCVFVPFPGLFRFSYHLDDGLCCRWGRSTNHDTIDDVTAAGCLGLLSRRSTLSWRRVTCSICVLSPVCTLVRAGTGRLIYFVLQTNTTKIKQTTVNKPANALE